MKLKYILSPIFVTFIFLFFIVSHVQAQNAATYNIENFESSIEIRQDTSFLISEKISVNFPKPQHGIFRIIATTYTNKGKTINTNLKIVSIKDENGADYKFSTSRTSQSITYKIGDPDKFIVGKHIYIITYEVKNFVLVYDSIPEVYWNVTGHEWDVPIQRSSVKILSPYAKITKIVCFTGVYKSTESNCESSFTDESAEFKVTEKINSGSDFTVSVGLDPNNDLKFPGTIEKTGNLIIDNWGYGASLVPLLIIFIVWFKKGRDEKYIGDNIYYKPKNNKTETVALINREFLPTVYSFINGLTPSEVGTIIDEKVDTHDLIAEIIEFGRLGIIKIEKIDKKGIFGKDDYSFTKLVGWEEKREKLKDFQKEILKELFRKETKNNYVLLSSLKYNFYQALDVIKTKLYKSLVKDEIFASDPERFRGESVSAYIVFSFIYEMVILSFYSSLTLNYGPFVLALLTVPFGILFASNMPKRKAWGYSLYRQIKGLKHYVEIGKWRHEIAEKDLFVKDMLPLAISLGIVDRLASDMKEIGMKPPDYVGNFTVGNFSSNFVSFQSSMARNFTAGQQSKSFNWTGHSSWSGGSSFSSGGGFSGGGGGGGGGGSW